MSAKQAIRGTVCAAGILVGLVASAAPAMAASTGTWTAVAENGRGIHFVGHGFTHDRAAGHALFNCRHSDLTFNPESCRIVADHPD
jgi:hypothetical protein